MTPACMSSAANEISGEALCRMCASVQNDRLPSRMITARRRLQRSACPSESVRDRELDGAMFAHL